MDAIRLIKEEIKKLSETNRDVLKYDPEKLKRLRTSKGMTEYLKETLGEKFEKDVELKDMPEMCVLLSEMDENDLLLDFPQLYWLNKIDEDRIKTNVMKEVCESMLEDYEEKADSLKNVGNLHLVEQMKRDTKKFCDTVLHQNFHEHCISYVKSMDNMRIDCGLVISRDPIFLGYE